MCVWVNTHAQYFSKLSARAPQPSFKHFATSNVMIWLEICFQQWIRMQEKEINFVELQYRVSHEDCLSIFFIILIFIDRLKSNLHMKNNTKIISRFQVFFLSCGYVVAFQNFGMKQFVCNREVTCKFYLLVTYHCKFLLKFCNHLHKYVYPRTTFEVKIMVQDENNAVQERFVL